MTTEAEHISTLIRLRAASSGPELDMSPEELTEVAESAIKGRKNDSGKRRWSLLPWGSLGLVVDVLGLGAAKYSDWNWARVPNGRERYLDALLRHLTARKLGQVLDPETGLPHLAHVVCNALFLLSLETGLDPHDPE